jgi:hypothetical protein
MLSINGYSMAKTSLSAEQIDKIKKDLTMKPQVNFDMGIKNKDEEVIFELYRETGNRIYIPRYYGLTNFGVPKTCKLTGGADISVDFIGKLRDAQIEPVKNFLEAAHNPQKMGGIISVPCGFGKTIMSLYIACLIKKRRCSLVIKTF